MKLFGLFMTSALAAKKNEGDRMFANEASFFTNLPASDSRWETDDKFVEKRHDQILAANAMYFGTRTWIPNNKGALRVAGFMSKMVETTMEMVEKVKVKPMCQPESGRKRRSDDELEPRFSLEPSDSNHKAMSDLFTNIARYARNELQRNCPKQSQRVLKRVDRMRQIWYWQSCRPEFDIDPQGQACSWAANEKSPRETQNKYNRETNVKITALGCQGAAELVCPAGGKIVVQSSRYGRRSAGECSKGAIAATTECWSKAGNNKQAAADACNGKSSCSFEYNDLDLCPGIDTYSRVQYICEKEE